MRNDQRPLSGIRTIQNARILITRSLPPKMTGGIKI